MPGTEQDEIRDLTSKEYRKAYAGNIVERNAMRATELRVFGKISEIDSDYSWKHTELLSFPSYAKIYPEELVKARKYLNKRERNVDSIIAGFDTATKGVQAAILATALTGGYHYATGDWPSNPVDDNNPDKQAILKLKESPANDTEKMIAERLEQDGIAIRDERTKTIKDRTHKSMQEAVEDMETNAKAAGAVAVVLAGGYHANKVSRRNKYRTQSPEEQTTEQSL